MDSQNSTKPHSAGSLGPIPKPAVTAVDVLHALARKNATMSATKKPFGFEVTLTDNPTGRQKLWSMTEEEWSSGRRVLEVIDSF